MLEETIKRHEEYLLKIDAKEDLVKEKLEEEILNFEFEIKKIQLKIKKSKVIAKETLKDLDNERKHFETLFKLTKSNIELSQRPADQDDST